MKVFLLKDIENVGLAHEMITVNDGYARNYLIPRNLCIEVTKKNTESFEKRAKIVEHRKSVIASKTSMLAEKIQSLTLTLTRKTHDGNKLFGSISPSELVPLFKEKGISVSKGQIDVPKTIKTTGLHKVTVKLSSTLQPQVTVKIVAE